MDVLGNKSKQIHVQHLYTKTENGKYAIWYYGQFCALQFSYKYIKYDSVEKLLSQRLYLDTNCCFCFPFMIICIACSHSTHSILNKNNWRTHVLVTSSLTMHACVFLNPQTCPLFPSTLITKTCNFPYKMLQLIRSLIKRPVWVVFYLKWIE